MEDLTKKVCVACEGGIPPLTPKQATEYQKQTPDWKIVDSNQKITKDFAFRNFKQALAFINQVGELAESEGHHPDIHNSYSKVALDLTTHAIDGLSENDFILAAKINLLQD